MSPARFGLGAACLAVPALLVFVWTQSAAGRLASLNAEEKADDVAIASADHAEYCTPELKRILRRVLQSCGLLSTGGGVRGCKPLEAQSLAAMQGSDFNALFTPMRDRGGIVQYDVGKSELDGDDTALVDKVFANQRGASYFFVVARASPEGSVTYNRNLSKARADAVMEHLKSTFNDPDLEREVGLLWLGEEYAQLDRQFCDWQRSDKNSNCDPRAVNRSAFISWIDCSL